MFDPEKKPHMPVSVGGRVKFEPIDQSQYLAMGGQRHEF